jgi:hypothetical protein
MRLLLTLILIIIPTISSAITHQEYFDTYLKNLTSKLSCLEYPGPLSKLVAKVALARQSLEDGLNRKSTVSIAGISTGGFNKNIVDQTILNSGLSVGYAFDSDGGRFYVFKGDEANIFSALCIGRLFNVYVGKFLNGDQKPWNLAKEVSKAIVQKPDSFELNHLFYVKLRPQKIIEKANRLYGPKHESVIGIANGCESREPGVN